MLKSTSGRSGRRIRGLYFVPVLLMVAFIAWALASPIGSSPDDDFHLPSAWCGTGEQAGICEEGSDEASRLVPSIVADGWECHARHPNTSGACQAHLLSEDGLAETDRVNSVRHLYPPVYYGAMSVLVTSDAQFSAVGMRIANALLFVVLVTATYALLPERRRGSMAWSWIATLVPLGMFLIASNNPSAWALISAGILWPSLVGYFESNGLRKVALASLAVIATVIGAGSRADSAIYSVLACIVAVVLTARRSRQYLLSAILPVGLIVVAYVLFRTSSQVGDASQGLGGSTGPGDDWRGLLFWNLANIPDLWAGSFGTWSLGWFDTEMPAIVWSSSLGLCAVVIFVGLTNLFWRKAIALCGILFALVVIPLYLLMQSGDMVGVNVQPRYLLPLIIIFVGVALVRSSGREGLLLTRPQWLLLVGTVTVANAVALHFTMRRYISGADVYSWNLNVHQTWWWQIPFSPMVVWAAGALAFGTAVWLVISSLSDVRRLEDDLADRGQLNALS